MFLVLFICWHDNFAIQLLNFFISFFHSLQTNAIFIEVSTTVQDPPYLFKNWIITWSSKSSNNTWNRGSVDIILYEVVFHMKPKTYFLNEENTFHDINVTFFCLISFKTARKISTEFLLVLLNLNIPMCFCYTKKSLIWNNKLQQSTLSL